MGQKSNVVCWFEIYVNDIERAKEFYSTVLALAMEDAFGPDGSQMVFFPSVENGPNAAGALVKMEGVKTGGAPNVSTLVYFQCEDCSVEESRVFAAGGSVQQSKFPIGEYGFCSICLDTEGNTFGLHSMK